MPDSADEELGYCPECGGEVWDLAESCQHCGAFIANRVSLRPPAANEHRKQWVVLIVIIVLVAFLLVTIF